MSRGLVLQVSLFGALDIRVDGRPKEIGVSGPTRSLLQYLLCAQGRLARREQLMEMFWPQSRLERRRSSLNSAIWRLKKTLESAGALSLHASADCVRLAGLQAEGVEVDFIQLDRALQAAGAGADPEDAALARLLAAIDNCPGRPLDGVDDEWATVERERLSALRLRSMTTAMRMLAARRLYDDALEVGRAILVHEPYRECAFQEILCLHVLNGERARALRLFDEFAASLDAELGIGPMVETRALRNYLAGDMRFGPTVMRGPGRADLGEIWGPGVGLLLGAIEHSREILSIPA